MSIPPIARKKQLNRSNLRNAYWSEIDNFHFLLIFLHYDGMMDSLAIQLSVVLLELRLHASVWISKLLICTPLIQFYADVQVNYPSIFRKNYLSRRHNQLWAEDSVWTCSIVILYSTILNIFVYFSSISGFFPINLCRRCDA